MLFWQLGPSSPTSTSCPPDVDECSQAFPAFHQPCMQIGESVYYCECKQGSPGNEAIVFTHAFLMRFTSGKVPIPCMAFDIHMTPLRGNKSTFMFIKKKKLLFMQSLGMKHYVISAISAGMSPSHTDNQLCSCTTECTCTTTTAVASVLSAILVACVSVICSDTYCSLCVLQ